MCVHLHQLHRWVGSEVVASCVTFTGRRVSEGTVFHWQPQELRTEILSLLYKVFSLYREWKHTLCQNHICCGYQNQMTVYSSSSLWHPHSINSSIRARFLHSFMAAWIPIGLCMNKFWLSLPHTWSRAINLPHKIYFHTCREVGKENVWKCQGDVTCHRDGKSYVGREASSVGYNAACIHTLRWSSVWGRGVRINIL